MELELRRLEDLAESIVNDFAYMRAREEEMRDTNGKQRRMEAIYMSEVIISRNPSIADTIGNQHFVLYSEMSLIQGLPVYFW